MLSQPHEALQLAYRRYRLMPPFPNGLEFTRSGSPLAVSQNVATEFYRRLEQVNFLALDAKFVSTKSNEDFAQILAVSGGKAS